MEMSMALAAEWHIDEPRLRVTERDARTALDAVAGRPVVSARARLRFGPGRTCESIARLLDHAIVRAEAAGLHPELLVVADGSAHAAEDVDFRSAAGPTATRTGYQRLYLQYIILQQAGLAGAASTGSAPASRAARRRARSRWPPVSRQIRPTSESVPCARRCRTSSTPIWA